MNKNWLLKIGLTVFSIWLFCPFFTSATVFHLTWLKQIYALSPDRILDNMMYVHFADGFGDNHDDFGGFLYFANDLWEEESAESTDLFEVRTISGKSVYECRSQVKWFYFNAERWERLWPLDNETWGGLSEDWLQMTWWIYTLCAQEGYQAALDKCEEGTYSECEQCDYNECVAKVRNDFSAGGYGYYWGIQQRYSGDTYNLIMWVDYDTPTDWFITPKSGSDLALTFVRLNNKFPVWFVYDNKWWLGLAWCMFGSGLTWGSMKNLVKEVKENWMAGVFRPAGTWYIMYSGTLPITCTGISFQDELTKILIEWIMWLSDSGTWWDTKFWTIGNSSDTKMQYFATKSVSNVTMMNYVRRRAELLCRWKWKDNAPSINEKGDKIICLDGVSVESTTTNLAKKFGKTLIVKNGNVTISPMSAEEYGSNPNKYYDIFILSGNLLIDEEGAGNFVIDNKGFIVDTNFDAFREFVIQREVTKIFNIVDISDVNDTNDEYLKCLGDCSGCSEENPYNCCNWGDPDKCQSWMDYDGDWFITQSDNTSLREDLVYQLQHPETNNNMVVAVASVLRWNFVVNWNVKAASGDVLNNKYFLYGKFTTKDTINSLENVFAWRCDNESGSDGYFCPRFDNNPYRNASLVVIDQNYPSLLLQS